ncbi:unnamed protein product [Closterium sp. Naga37s-1]|nr:unnamed protein product [Closterium sp. Naga37s-1]
MDTRGSTLSIRTAGARGSSPPLGSATLDSPSASARFLVTSVAATCRALPSADKNGPPQWSRAPHDDDPSLPPCLSGAAFLTAAASASIFPLACSGGGGGGGSVDPFAAQAKPLLWKGKALSKALPLYFLPSLRRGVASRKVEAAGALQLKYVVKFRPTKVKGKVVGDKGASAKLVITGVMYSSTLYYLRIRFRTLNVNSGGSIPTIGSGPSCTSPTTVSFAYPMINITSNKVGRRKHYSFKYLDELDHSCTVADLRTAVALLVSRLGKYPKVYHSKNLNALCGKVQKVV